MELLLHNESDRYYHEKFSFGHFDYVTALADQSLVMNLYKVHNMPALQPELHVQFEYQLEGEYLAITKDKQYAALLTA